MLFPFSPYIYIIRRHSGTFKMFRARSKRIALRIVLTGTKGRGKIRGDIYICICIDRVQSRLLCSVTFPKFLIAACVSGIFLQPAYPGYFCSLRIVKNVKLQRDSHKICSVRIFKNPSSQWRRRRFHSVRQVLTD